MVARRGLPLDGGGGPARDFQTGRPYPERQPLARPADPDPVAPAHRRRRAYRHRAGLLVRLGLADILRAVRATGRLRLTSVLLLVLAASCTSPVVSVRSSPTVAPAATAAPTALTTTRLAEIARSITVRIEQDNDGFLAAISKGPVAYTGSGVYAGGDLVLTAAHVVSSEPQAAVLARHSSKKLRVFVNDKPFDARTLTFDRTNDLAVLEAPGIDASGARPATWGDPARLSLGDPLIVAGFPANVGFTVTSGIFSGIKRIGEVAALQTDAAVNSGNSGGPVIDARGAVVGIADFNFPGYVGLNFAVSAVDARERVERVAKRLTFQDAVREREILKERAEKRAAALTFLGPEMPWLDAAELMYEAAVLVERSSAAGDQRSLANELARLDRDLAEIMYLRGFDIRNRQAAAARGQQYVGAGAYIEERQKSRDEAFAQLLKRWR